MNINIFFYDEGSISPIIKFIESLSGGEKAEIIRYFDLLEEYGLNLGSPYIQKIGVTHDLWQLKIPYGKNDIFFIFLNKSEVGFIILTGFRNDKSVNIKKELEASLKRLAVIDGRKDVL